MNRVTSLALLAVAGSFAFATPGALAATTTFDSGTGGWGVYGENNGVEGDFPLADGGNGGANLRFFQTETWWVNLHNDSDSSILGDYSRFSGPVTFSVDVKVNHIIYDPFFDGGSEVERNLIVELVDNNPPGSTYPYTSVWYNLGPISQALTGDWTTFSTTITDTTSSTLPPGWGGTGAETAFGEPLLPADRTFASVLASVDEVRFTTLEPGWFYGFTYFDLQYDNVGVVAVPEPMTAALLIPAALAGLRRRRAR